MPNSCYCDNIANQLHLRDWTVEWVGLEGLAPNLSAKTDAREPAPHGKVSEKMRRKLPHLCFAAVGALVISAMATVYPVESPSHVARASAPNVENRSYLGSALRQLVARVPPPPAGTAVVEADERAFRATRALNGSLRWKLAARDANHSTKSLMMAFSCAAGVQLSADGAPQLAALLTVSGADAARVASHAKARFPRERPFALYGGQTCLSPEHLGVNRDYPSGHSARGWTWGLVLAQLIPNRREELTSRAKAYAESRVICGFHSPSGAEGGRAVAMLTVDTLMRNSRFRTDMQRASKELLAIKEQGQHPPVGQCRPEDALKYRSY